MDPMPRRVVIYGGNGALGSKCVSLFGSNSFSTISIDFANNSDAEFNIILNKGDDMATQEKQILSALSDLLNNSKLDAVICVAGGWTGGNATSDLTKNTDLMWSQNVTTSMISASVSSKHLKEGGLLILTGAKAAMEGTPEMISYGIAKAAVHQLTKSLADEKSGLPEGVQVLTVLPTTLDTSFNRLCMPTSDTSSWTPLEFVADLFVKWTTNGDSRPKNGSLCQLVTINFITEVIIT